MMEDPTYNLPEDFLSLPSPNLFFSPNLASPGFLSTPGATSNFASNSYFSFVPGAKYTPLPPAEEVSTTFSSSRISLAPPPASLLRSQLQQEQKQQPPLFPEEQRRESFVTKQTFDGLILSCSENVRRFLGYDALSLYNTSTYELIHPDDLDKILQVHLKLIEGGQGTKLQATYRVLRKSGDYADIKSTFVAEGSSIACYSVDLCPAKSSPPVAFFCSEELVSSSASLSSPASSSSSSLSSSSQEQVSLGSIDCVRCELRAFEDSLQPQESDEEVLDEGVFAGAALHSHPSHSPALSPEYSPNRHSSECTSEGNSEYEFEEDDKDETYHSHPLKARSKPKTAKVSKATSSSSSSSATAGRTRDGNPKRERRMRRPPFGESCGECHIFESTEWRKGPNPNRLLCNACGLRYTRKVKKEMKEKLTSQ